VCYYSASAHVSARANTNTWQYDGSSSNASTVLDPSHGQFELSVLASGMLVIGESGIGAYEDIVTYTQPVPELHPTFNGNTIANYDIIFNEAV
jgi:hypothetical protein